MHLFTIRRLIARLMLAGLIAPGVAGAPAAAAAQDARCAPGEIFEARLEAVGQRGELQLASGRRIVLSGIGWPDETDASGAATTWLAALRGTVLDIRVRGRPDRWGRSQADVLTKAAEPVDLAGDLVAAGLVAAASGEDDVLCRKDLLALEEPPRAARRGVWFAPVHDPREGGTLERLEGDFIVAQGRIVSVGERAKRSYLNFARFGERGLTVTVPKRTWRIMQDRGLSAATLKGRLVRVRGRVEVWRGPVLDIGSAEMIEVLEGGQAQTR